MAKSSIQVLARYISEKRGVPQRDAEHFVKSFFEIISETLQSGESLVKIKGFGTFKIVDVKDRESVDVNTGERIVIEGRSKISFTPDNVMKELVNKPFSQFETVVVNDGVNFEEEGVQGVQEVQGVQDKCIRFVMLSAGAIVLNSLNSLDSLNSFKTRK